LKPHDVKEPTLITDDRGLDFCAATNIAPFYQAYWNGWKEFPASYSSPAGFGSLWIPCDPCLDYWEISTPKTVSTHYREESMLSPSGVCPSFGPLRQRCLKVLDTFWTIETRRNFWQEGEICELDSRCIKRLARAYRLAKEIESSSFLPKVVDRCPDYDWTRLRHLS
ncbi:4681_t:CDS:1, partial [Scutellospora calospora]